MRLDALRCALGRVANIVWSVAKAPLLPIGALMESMLCWDFIHDGANSSSRTPALSSIRRRQISGRSANQNTGEGPYLKVSMPHLTESLVLGKPDFANANLCDQLATYVTDTRAGRRLACGDGLAVRDKPALHRAPRGLGQRIGRPRQAVLGGPDRRLRSRS
jgi:hypothetical protein